MRCHEASNDDPVVEINEYGVDADDEDELDSEKWQDQQTETLLRVFKKFKPDWIWQALLKKDEDLD